MTEKKAQNAIAQIGAALGVGLIFGFGLSLSGMLDPKRVRGFLDVAGDFDPSLGFVLVGAVAVSAAGYLMSRGLRRPLFSRAFHVPTRRDVDGRLLVGSAIFGVGWGAGGLCPGPAMASLALGLIPSVVFVLAMLLGVYAHDAWATPRRPARLEEKLKSVNAKI